MNIMEKKWYCEYKKILALGRSVSLQKYALVFLSWQFEVTGFNRRQLIDTR